MSDNQILAEIRERIVRVETKIDAYTETKETADNAERVAHKALESTKSAHNRIDKIDKTIFWVASTVIGGVVLAVLSLIFTGGN